MAPIRRYLRITRYTVLEVRLYLENPSIADSWLLSSRSPALPRIIEAVRPLVLPKLREENENAKKKGSKKKKATKDVVTRDDFEVAIYLTETSSSHTLLTKRKEFVKKERLKAGDKLGIARFMNGGGEEDPVDIEDDGVVIRQESDDEGPRLEDIPEALPESLPAGAEEADAIDVSSGDEDVRPGRKRKRGQEGDDKKKLGLKTEYEGFSIYGKILCLVVKRKGVKARGDGLAGGSQMLESWVSTQVEREGAGLDDEG